MTSKKKNKHIAILFKEEVRIFDHRYIAGCERVFLDDTFFLKTFKLLSGAYMAAKNNKTRGVHSIPYPHKYLDIIHGSYVYKIVLLVIQLWYTGVFVLKEFNTEYYYVIQVPMVALFFPKKTTIMYHNFSPGLQYLFRIIYLLRKDASYIKYIFVSQNLMDQFLHEYPMMKKNRCYVLHNAVNPQKENRREKPVDKISFIFLSAWVKAKGIYLLPKIIRAVNKKYRNRVHFIIGGSVDLWSLPDDVYKKYGRIENTIHDLATVFPNVTLLGPVQHTHVPTVLHSATFCLLPSIADEQNSLLAKESLANGTPVIAFDVGGNREIISQNKDGYLIKGKAVYDYIQCITDLVENFDIHTYRKMSTRAIQNTEKYSETKRHRLLLKILYS